MRISSLLTVAFLSTVVVLSSGAAPTVIPVAQFRSVELQGGGNVIVRHGKTQRVTMLEGSLRYSRVRLAGGQRLVIDKCVTECPRHYQMQIEVITPELSAVSVS